MDGFYAQVEAQKNPALKGKPVAVLQWQGIIAIRSKNNSCKAHCASY
jgi:nucleotidyltransferase/DNA polymerase involved in DNA repair